MYFHRKESSSTCPNDVKHVSSIVTELQVHACVRQLGQMCDFSDLFKKKTDIWLRLLFRWMRTMMSSTGTLCHSCTIPQENHMLYMAEQPSLTSIAHHCLGADSLLRIYRPETSERHGAVQPRSPGQGSARWGISSRDVSDCRITGIGKSHSLFLVESLVYNTVKFHCSL